MQDLSLFNTNITMTLKEITDLLEVEHNKAKKIVERMANNSEFGTVEKYSTVYNKQGQTIETYTLNKTQSITIAAKLNTDLLIRIVKRWQELEYNNKPIKEYTELELARNYVKVLEQKEELEAQMLINKPKVEAFDNAKAIFPKKEYSEGEKAYKKDIKELYPFLDNGKINNILEYYTSMKYKDTNYYIKAEIEECMKKFFRDCKYRISNTKMSVIATHECLLNSKCVISKDYSIEYLEFVEEEFE